MGSARMFRGRWRLLAWALVVVGVTIAVIAVTSAGPSARNASAQVAACTPGTAVQTADGPVCGTSATNGVNEWLGIPYAQPPVGALRWAPPQAHTPWSTTLEATQFANECP